MRAYTYWLKRFNKWARDNTVSLLGATAIDVRTYTTSGDWSRKTRSQVLSALKAFYRYCVMEGFIPFSPAESLQHPRLFAKRLPAYTVVEARRLLATSEWVSDALVVGLGLYAGIRTSEALGIEVGDLSLTEALLHVRRTFGEPTTKSRRERAIPIHERLREPLKVAVRVQEERIFDLTSECGYRLRFRAICKRADVPYRGPHALRRTFATRLRELDVREGVIRQLLGHAMRVEDLYISTTTREMRGAIRRLVY